MTGVKIDIGFFTIANFVLVFIPAATTTVQLLARKISILSERGISLNDHQTRKS
jgi:hypothetical protein